MNRRSFPCSPRVLAVASLAFVALSGCIEEDDPLEAEPEKLDEAVPADPSAAGSTEVVAGDHFIDADEAADLALYIGARDIDELTPVPDEFGEEVFHIINYRGGGFVILAADDRVTPVLAFADEGRFDLDSELFPEGLVNWLSDQRDYVQEIRAQGDDDAVAKIEVCKMAELVQRHASDIQAPSHGAEMCGGGGGCQDQHQSVGPLMTTTWGQTGGYNNALDDLGCGGDGRPPTGCVATAMAQVMRYHEEPPSYDWAAMPNGYGTSATATLMRDAGEAVGMDYGCDGSGAKTSDVPGALKNQFGFSSATHTDYNHTLVKGELNAGRPVILAGGKKSGWWIFASYTDGHAWVTDGYTSSFLCESGNSLLYLRMNWGWDGAYNGLYAFNNWNPSGYTFNYQRKMVYNIRP